MDGCKDVMGVQPCALVYCKYKLPCTAESASRLYMYHRLMVLTGDYRMAGDTMTAHAVRRRGNHSSFINAVQSYAPAPAQLYASVHMSRMELQSKNRLELRQKEAVCLEQLGASGGLARLLL